MTLTILIDGSGFIYRAFYALPALVRSDGTPINAVLGFCNSLARLLETDADHIAVVFDANKPTWRHKVDENYKANRKPPPLELAPQFSLVRQAADAFSVCWIESPGYEADDLIATYARHAVEAGHEVLIYSSDKDLMQLIRPSVTMYDPLKDKVIGIADVENKWGVRPEKMIDLQALCGDSADNVAGVPGIGPKTAAELINHYGDLDTLLACAGEIRQPGRRAALLANADKALMARRLVTLDDDVPLPVPLEDLQVRPREPHRLRAFLREQEFRELERKLL